MNGMYVNNEFVYVSTNSGIVVLDTKRKVFTHYYDFGVRVNDVVVHDDAIMAVTPNGVFKGELSTNLLDASNWKKISDYNFRCEYRVSRCDAWRGAWGVRRAVRQRITV